MKADYTIRDIYLTDDTVNGGGLFITIVINEHELNNFIDKELSKSIHSIRLVALDNGNFKFRLQLDNGDVFIDSFSECSKEIADKIKKTLCFITAAYLEVKGNEIRSSRRFSIPVLN